MWKYIILLLFGLCIKTQSLRFEDINSSEEFPEGREEPQQLPSKMASMTW
jgi:hypothetical protein